MQAQTETPLASVMPLWRTFSSLSVGEAAYVLERWTCHHPTQVCVTCVPGRTSFAVVGPDGRESYHWSVFSVTGQHLDTGWEKTLEAAQRVAAEVQQLWSHRCELKHHCRCSVHRRQTGCH